MHCYVDPVCWLHTNKKFNVANVLIRNEPKTTILINVIEKILYIRSFGSMHILSFYFERERGEAER